MMGNEQSGPSKSRVHPSSHQASGPVARSRVINGDLPPPPYTPVDAAGTLIPPPRVGELHRSRSYGRDSNGRQRDVLTSADVRRSSSASRAPTPSGSNVSGFRFDSDPNRSPPPNRISPNITLTSGPAEAAAAVASGRAGVRRSNTAENLLDMLRKYNTLILVDDSSSMAGRRWKDTRAALAELAKTASQYDVDGVDIRFLNSTVVGSNVKTARAVESLFDSVDPDGITPTGEKLEILLLDYILRIEEAQDRDRADPTAKGTALKAIKPLNLIVLTDGEPSDDPESVIITAAKRLDARHFPLSQIGIQFVQIGDDVKATDALRELDENLANVHGIRDMVDMTPYTPNQGQLSAHDLAKMLLGGFNRRVDKRGVS